MTVIGQALHVARKDIRESSWPIAVYAALVVLAAVGVVATSSPVWLLSIWRAMYFVVISGMVLVAILVQSDSPGRTDAFWATRPLKPTAVVTAKLLVAAVVVLGFALVAQSFALSSFDVHGMALLRRLPAAAFAYGCWLLVAMALAAVTKDLKTLIVALLFTLVVTYLPWVFLAAWIWNAPVIDANSWSAVASRLIGLFGAAGSVALLFWLYRRRERGPRAIVAASAAVVGALIGAFGTPPLSVSPSASGPDVGGRTAIQVSMSRTHSGNIGDVLLDVRPTTTPPGRALTLWDAHAELELSDGTKLRPTTTSPIVDLYSVRPSLSNNRWLGTSLDSTFAGLLWLRADAAQLRALDRGIRRITITGRVWETVPRVVGTMPLVIDSRLTSSGRRAMLTSWSHNRGQGEMRVDVTQLPWPVADAGPRVVSTGGPLAYALVNDARHEALPLFVNGASHGASWLVMPGDAAWMSNLTLRTQAYSNGPESPVDDRWFDGARLWFIDWVPVDSYPVRAEVTLSNVSPP